VLCCCCTTDARSSYRPGSRTCTQKIRNVRANRTSRTAHTKHNTVDTMLELHAYTERLLTRHLQLCTTARDLCTHKACQMTPQSHKHLAKSRTHISELWWALRQRCAREQPLLQLHHAGAYAHHGCQIILLCARSRVLCWLPPHNSTTQQHQIPESLSRLLSSRLTSSGKLQHFTPACTQPSLMHLLSFSKQAVAPAVFEWPTQN
jgi:hypothetical protein